jgi:NIPSNAP
MQRREALLSLAGSTLSLTQSNPGAASTVYLDLTTWRFHNSNERQAARVADYLQNGLQPALSRAGARLAGAFSNLIGGEGPYYITLSEFSSLGAMETVISKLETDEELQREMQKLDRGPGLPFVRVESSLLRTFGMAPEKSARNNGENAPPRIFELRRYESQTFNTLRRKISMFTGGEMQIFQRLGMRPVFFGATIVGPKQPNLMYMLSYDDLAARERLWRTFGSDPEWKKISAPPEMSDAEIVSNISNVILQPLTFSAIR